MVFVRAGESWKCAHCGAHILLDRLDIDDNQRAFTLQFAADKVFAERLQTLACRNCRKITSIFSLSRVQLDSTGNITRDPSNHSNVITNVTYRTIQVLPTSSAPKFPDSVRVPAPITKDLEEAHAIRDLSPRAAAVLGRRCVQSIMRDYYEVKKQRTLHAEIESARSKGMPGALFDALMAVKLLGNIGAHPEQDIDLIVDVAEDEVAVLLDVVEHLVANTYVKRADEEALLRKVKEIADAKRSESDA
jgi:uncharacterized protein DUF4145